MSRACPEDFDSPSLRRHVSEMYGRIAAAPDETFRFDVGGDYGGGCLGYDRDDVTSLPV